MLHNIGIKYLALLNEIGGCLLFLWTIIKTAITKPTDRKVILEQLYEVSIQSLPTTILSGLFVGAIFAVQFNVQLVDYGAQGFVGGLNTSATVREVGPMLIAFMLAGKIGAYITAELGTMKVTEQIDAIRCLGVDPIQFLVVPRFIGVVTASFMLLVFGLIIGILGGIIVCYLVMINPLLYISTIPRFVTLWSVMNGIGKSLVFGLLIATISLYKGYTTTGGAKGVGEAVNKTAVAIVISIVLADYLTSFWSNIAFRLFMDN